MSHLEVIVSHLFIFCWGSIGVIKKRRKLVHAKLRRVLIFYRKILDKKSHKNNLWHDFKFHNIYDSREITVAIKSEFTDTKCQMIQYEIHCYSSTFFRVIHFLTITIQQKQAFFFSDDDQIDRTHWNKDKKWKIEESRAHQ